MKSEALSIPRTGSPDWQIIHPPYCEWVLIHNAPNPIHVLLTRGEAEVRVNDEPQAYDLPLGAIVEFAGMVQVHNKFAGDEGKKATEEPETEVRYKHLW